MASFPLDSVTVGVRFHNLTTSIQNDHIRLRGDYVSSGLLPVLLFSVGVPWLDPCVKHVCCLWDVAERYKDHDLLAALGPTCDENTNFTSKDLMKGNPASAAWVVDTMIHPSFVAMLFLCLTPSFYMYYEILPMQWIDTNTVHWSASWYGKACHTVIYPDGRQVCIACFNTKPENAVFVFTANWFTTFQCQWVCKPGYMGPNCELTVDLVIYVCGSLVGVVLIVLMVVCRPRRHLPERVPEEPPVKASVKSEMIAFKDNALSEIRIKLL